MGGGNNGLIGAGRGGTIPPEDVDQAGHCQEERCRHGCEPHRPGEHRVPNRVLLPYRMLERLEQRALDIRRSVTSASRFR